MSGEEDTKTFKDRNVLVVGLARSGTGAANLLTFLGAKVYITDTKPFNSLKENIKRLSPTVKISAGGHPLELFNNADIIVVSPGVPLDIPPLVHAKAKGTPIIGELELTYQIVMSDELRVMSENSKLQTPAFIAVTGTNGKSTATTIIDLILKRAGFKTLIGGNIGNALCGEILKWVMGQEKIKNKKSKIKNEKFQNFEFCNLNFTFKDAPCPLPLDYIVAEVSSFQLESIKDFRPKIAVILNITPDHLDRYHNIQEYINAKARIFENQRVNDYLILNADDPIIKRVESEKLKVKRERPKVLYFSKQREVEGVYFRDGMIYCNISNLPLAPCLLPLISADEIRIKGVHNLENVMAACVTALLTNCSLEAIKEVLRSFAGLEHRLEFVREVDGVSFINDSKGTNIGAVSKSLESLQNVILIMGGRDKGGDFTVLKDLIRERVKSLILLGEAREKIAMALTDMTDTVFVDSLKEAIEVSNAKAVRGDVVLFSPGCASFDMFVDFEDRGRRFKEAVYAIKNSKSQIPNYK